MVNFECMKFVPGTSVISVNIRVCLTCEIIKILR